MKPTIILTAALLCLTATAQSSLKLVDGKIYSMDDPSWTTFYCNMEVTGFASDDGIIVQCFTTRDEYSSYHSGGNTFGSQKTTRRMDGQKIILKHYPNARRIVFGEILTGSVKAVRVSMSSVTSGAAQVSTYESTYGSAVSKIYDDPGNAVVYDMGVDYYPPPVPLTPEQIVARKKRKADQEARTVRWLQEQATNGMAGEQYVLGLRYLKGDGVPQDETTGKMWLEKSSEQGNLSASNALAVLSVPKTNSLAAASPAK